MIILRYLEGLITTPKEKVWVFDKCEDFPVWDETKLDYVFSSQPKRISAKEARELIKKHNLNCVCSNKYGEIYVEHESKD